jgi:hypothetical protein
MPDQLVVAIGPAIGRRIAIRMHEVGGAIGAIGTQMGDFERATQA